MAEQSWHETDGKIAKLPIDFSQCSSNFKIGLQGLLRYLSMKYNPVIYWMS